MELSKRLRAVAGLVEEGASVADIGTDHGYIPIYLAENGICAKVFALDIRIGPLERAKFHIAKAGLESQIETRLADGLSGMEPGEADTMIAAGMGGSLVIKILSLSPDVTESLKTLILQPQSEISSVRRYLNANGFRITAEDMVEENGKYYPMMKAVHGPGEPYKEAEYLYGKRLLEGRHPVLLAFLYRERRIKKELLKRLEGRGGKRAGLRAQELKRELILVEEALLSYSGFSA